MKILVYADFRSPHAQGWIKGLTATGIDVIAVSSELSNMDGIIDPHDKATEMRQAFTSRSKSNGSLLRKIRKHLTRIQLIHSVVQVYRGRQRGAFLQDQVRLHRPDLIHALRLPYEGISTLSSIRDVPVVVSTWGQDFTSQAKYDPLLRIWYHRLLKKAAGFMADEEDDITRARKYGLPSHVPQKVAAGNFGIDSSLFYFQADKKLDMVLYPRRATPNNNYKGFLHASMKLIPETRVQFVGVGLAGQVKGLQQADKSRLKLTDDLDREEFAFLMRGARVVVSPAYSDGMPNSVLEALACGARVVAGDLPQLRKLQELDLPIDLVDPKDESALAGAIKKAINLPTPSAAPNLPNIYSILHNSVAVPAFYTTVISQHAKASEGAA